MPVAAGGLAGQRRAGPRRLPGHRVTPASRGRDVLVTGWNTAGLDSRLTAMRAILHQLADNPLLTARAAIERFRGLPAAARSPAQTWELLERGAHRPALTGCPRGPASMRLRATRRPSSRRGHRAAAGTAARSWSRRSTTSSNAISGSPGMRSHCSARCGSRWTSAGPGCRHPLGWHHLPPQRPAAQVPPRPHPAWRSHARSGHPRAASASAATVSHAAAPSSPASTAPTPPTYRPQPTGSSEADAVRTAVSRAAP